MTEEESTGNGALSTLVRGYRAEAALVPEPTGGTITRAHTGTLWFRIAVRGVPVHVAGGAVRQQRHPVRLSPDPGAAGPYQGDQRGGEGAPLVRARSSRPLKFNPGIIRGGDWASSTPAWCEVDCRIGLLPGTDVAEARAAVERCVAEAAKTDNFLANNPPSVTWHGFLADGYVLEPGTEAEAVLAAAHPGGLRRGRCRPASPPR